MPIPTMKITNRIGTSSIARPLLKTDRAGLQRSQHLPDDRQHQNRKQGICGPAANPVHFSRPGDAADNPRALARSRNMD
jgi:hypothetical protein